VTSQADPGPIACSLDAGSLTERVDEWRAFVASSVVEVESDATSVHLVLCDSEAALVAAASLGQREKQCCGFFEVNIEIGSDGRVLTLRVPDGAEEAMATFVALLRP
jgi:hypothetical protein